MAKGKSRTEVLRDLQKLEGDLQTRICTLENQKLADRDRVAESIEFSSEELDRRIRAATTSLKKVKASIRWMKKNPGVPAMIPKIGDNTEKSVPGGVQGKGTISGGSKSNSKSKMWEVD